MDNNKKNLQPVPNTEEPQRGITIIESESSLKGLTLRHLAEEKLIGILIQLRIQKTAICYEHLKVEFWVPQKIGKTNTRPKGRIKLRRVLEY